MSIEAEEIRQNYVCVVLVKKLLVMLICVSQDTNKTLEEYGNDDHDKTI